MAGNHGMQQHPPPPIRSQQPERTLPCQSELAARVEEAKNSAKLLMQFIQTTPQSEMEDNDLIKEFVDRCRSSSRLIQTYIHATNPTPDEETLLTLIECNDEISVALSQQQRAMLKARKSRGSPTPNLPSIASLSSPTNELPGSSSPVSQAPQREPTKPEQQAPLIDLSSTTTMSGGRPNASRANGERYEYDAAAFEVQNPFADDYATAETDRYRQNNAANASNTDRARFQPSEQER